MSKYYEINQDAVINAQNRVFDAIDQSNERHSLNLEDEEALGRFLAYCLESGDDNGKYEAIVDFLWMSFRIENSHKMLLLDLVNE